MADISNFNKYGLQFAVLACFIKLPQKEENVKSGNGKEITTKKGNKLKSSTTLGRFDFSVYCKKKKKN